MLQRRFTDTNAGAILYLKRQRPVVLIITSFSRVIFADGEDLESRCGYHFTARLVTGSRVIPVLKIAITEHI